MFATDGVEPRYQAPVASAVKTAPDDAASATKSTLIVWRLKIVELFDIKSAATV
jgi:hypothetical protein